MTSTEPRTDIFEHRPDEPVSDALLLQAARDGSTAAFGVLYARHRDHAVAVARRTLPAADASLAEDVAEAAFMDVFTALRNGKGPTDTLRYYLVTSVRRQAWRTQRRVRRQADTVDRWATEQRATIAAEPDAPVGDGPDGLGSHGLLTEAYRGLSERWRHVLWLTEVEGRKPAEIAAMLGVSASTASALAYRARQGLLAAYVGAYRARRHDPACEAVASRLAEYVAAGPEVLGFDDVTAHLDGCASCRDLARGVDIGGVVGAIAPFGLLTAGWWAQGVTAGGAKVGLTALAGAAGGGAAAGGVSAGAGGTGAAGGGAAAGAGAVGVVAAGIVAAVVVAGVAVGLVRASDRAPEAAAASSADVAVEGTSTDRPPVEPGPSLAPTVTAPPLGTPTTAPPFPGLEPTPAPGPTSGPDRAIASTTTAPPSTSTVPSSTTTVPASTTSTTAATTTSTTTPSTTSSVPITTTTMASTTSTEPSSTTTTRPDDPEPGSALSGAVLARPPGSDVLEGVEGIRIVVATLSSVHEVRTDGAGRWAVASLPASIYVVTAEVPARFRPEVGLDPWTGGPVWTQVLGVVVLGEGSSVDLVDLRLVER